MDLELATMKDIVEELHRRNVSFVFVGAENANSPQENLVCFAAQGASADEIFSLMRYGREALDEFDDDEGGQEWLGFD